VGVESLLCSKCDVIFIHLYEYYKRFLVVQNLKIAESSMFIFSKLFD